ncbi:DUF4167 domain-containing protein [Maritimibacter sp. DP1N21-5]|uniref:DUF4167 domain-containing protein n=1 Tax=Maritimibacter sp. DP1N21-5 TaxID=2836867 RepID=UPI001C43FB91|nr:DUF4167 domain-containing protein [Maritimibacter sp. DP1N21-5]MBV7409758.1 DUF4167 domain-containing protein [Maritimibacter sp. DP1N21-5]
MRSSKSRSRGKNNRNRSPSNNLNRVFDSSGPEGKVRGTPQQIIDKYTQLSRDAFLGNDRVAGENFQQHAEHYARLLSEAQKDADSKRQNQQGQQGGQNQPDTDGAEGDATQGNGGNGGNNGGAPDGRQSDGRQNRDEQRRREKQGRREQQEMFTDPGSAPQPDVMDTSAEEDQDSGLVETPEEKPKKPRTRKPRAKKTDGDGATEAAGGKEAPEAAE